MSANTTAGRVSTGDGGGLEDVHAIAARALDEVNGAADLAALERIRNLYLGRGDGLLSAQRKRIGQIVDAEARRQAGQTVNDLYARVEDALVERRQALEREAEAVRAHQESIDLTRPPQALKRGHLHPVSRCAREIRRIFSHLGYLVVSGPEIEYERYNFELINMPPGHPTRDLQDTFWVDDARLLRTHTSPVQIRSMIALGAPLRVIVPGKVFRRDYDATHFPMFHQVEGLCVDEGIALSDLKGTLEFFARSMFGSERAIRLRPHHFAYTEPSLEVDVSCMVCGGDGCHTCRGSGWIEILGSGMVHPNVLRNGGIDPERYSGFAFGAGIERIAQLAWGIDDGRLLYENDLRFTRQA
ncbi:MAG TPA: phenylalanine--tRNA ligase subunit alpha [Candidatus Dormibacteraeota bacterium]|nr:phenylalanine--tRNA ligase subunit alpha [Candidatus Dormibacteraeota bacterium]